MIFLIVLAITGWLGFIIAMYCWNRTLKEWDETLVFWEKTLDLADEVVKINDELINKLSQEAKAKGQEGDTNV